jgi:hypothetical protein
MNEVNELERLNRDRLEKIRLTQIFEVYCERQLVVLMWSKRSGIISSPIRRS